MGVVSGQGILVRLTVGPAYLLLLALGCSRKLGDDPLFGFAPGTGKHVPVLSYPHAKPFDIVREAGDSLSLLCKLQGSRGKVLPEAHVSTSFRFVEEPTYLGS